MIEFIESSMRFSFPANRCFRIETAEAYRDLSPYGISSVECVFTKTVGKEEILVFLEAKTSTPNPNGPNRKNLEMFLKSMRRKYLHSIQLCYAILHKRQSSMEKIGNALAAVLSEPQRICLVLVVKEYEAAWCVQMKDTLAVALKDILRIWKAEVLVLSEEMAREHSIIA